MNNKISIRLYSKCDRSNILLLLTELQDYIARLDEWKLEKPEADFDAELYLAETFRLIRNNEGRIFVAVSKEKIVGFIVGIISKRTKICLAHLYPLKRGAIIEFVVDKSFRRHGVGALLLQSMEDYFFSKKCDIVDVECFIPNKLAYGFYRKSGYTDRSLFLAKRLIR